MGQYARGSKRHFWRERVFGQAQAQVAAACHDGGRRGRGLPAFARNKPLCTHLNAIDGIADGEVHAVGVRVHREVVACDVGVVQDKVVVERSAHPERPGEHLLRVAHTAVAVEDLDQCERAHP